jgi:acyl-CoA synthetase (AMP-forming)/AMP-acid ligase II
MWVGDVPRLGAAQCPDRPAIIFPDRGVQRTYRDLDRSCDACVALLREQGIKAGDRVAYLGKNNDLYFSVLLGAVRAEVVVVPLNWRLTAPEITYQLRDSNARLLFCDPEFMLAAAQAVAGLKAPPA